MGEWKECKLGEICSITMGQSPKSEYYNFCGNGIPFLQGNRTFGYKYPTFNIYTSNITKKADKNDIIMSVRAPVGDINVTPIEICLGRGLCGLKMNNNNQEYLYYLLKANIANIINNENGTIFGSINKNDIEELSIVVIDDFNEQKQIAEILSSFDDKIDLLNRQNKTLEQLAQTYFRQWFIEEANEDWEEKGLDEIANFLNGLPLQKFPYKTGEFLKIIKIKELNNGFSNKSDICCSDIDKKYIVENGDVIFSWSGSLVLDFWKYGKGALNQHLFKVTSTDYPKWFYYFWIKQHLEEFRNIAVDKATTMGHIQRHHLSDAHIKIPNKNELCYMNKLMSPLIEKILSNNNQLQTLQQLQDSLLPKLISGEVRIKN